jgi:hypothetical protein
LYFISRIEIRSEFKFEFESKEFNFLKDLNKGKTISYFLLGFGPKLSHWPNLACLTLTLHDPVASPAKAQRTSCRRSIWPPGANSLHQPVSKDPTQ